MHKFRAMTPADYDQAYELWLRTAGLAISAADSRAEIESYLARNEGFSQVCERDGSIIGTALCGHDGRRGYLYHAAVDDNYRGQAIGTMLVDRCLERLQQAGIVRCHLMVIASNEIGNRFWSRSGWYRQDGILVYSSNTERT